MARLNSGGSVKIDGEVTNVIANSGKTTISGIVSQISGVSNVIYGPPRIARERLLWT
jgi:hypothetical protein